MGTRLGSNGPVHILSYATTSRGLNILQEHKFECRLSVFQGKFFIWRFEMSKTSAGILSSISLTLSTEQKNDIFSMFITF